LHCYRNLQRNKLIIKEMGGIIRNGVRFAASRREGVTALRRQAKLQDCTTARLHDLHDLHDFNHPAEAGQKP
jgi:hypothetical protein